MKLSSIQELLEDIRLGKPVILMDDEDRENEGDLIVAAEKISAETINFMIREARGLLCLTLTGEHCDRLSLSQMVNAADNGSGYGTPFTISIEAAEGVTTGISAQDRAVTILTAVAPDAKPSDIVQPGHIFPLRARQGGVLSRAGHTEAGCDLARMAGLTPAAAIIEIINDDGTMARRPDLEKFAEKHLLRIGTIADLIHYRMLNEQTIARIEQRTIQTAFGEFTLSVYEDRLEGHQHIALSKGSINGDTPTLVRVQTMEALKDLLAIQFDNDTSWSLHHAMAKIAAEGNGVIVLLDNSHDHSISATLDRLLGHHNETLADSPSQSLRVIGTGSQILCDLGVQKMRLMSSPIRFTALSGFNLEVTEYIPFTENLTA